MSKQPVISGSGRAFLRQKIKKKINDLWFVRFRRLIGECVMRYSCSFDRVLFAILQDFKARRLLGRAQSLGCKVFLSMFLKAFF